MKLTKLPADIVKRLPSPGPGYLTPDLLESLSRADRRELLSRVPREKFEPMVETVVGWIDQMEMAQGVTPEAWQRRMESSIRPALLAGKLSVMQVVAAAERCRAIDLALRKIVVEGDLPADIAALSALQAYKDRALLRDITVDPPGFEDNFPRDIGITVLMTLTMVRWPYLGKRVKNPASKQVSASMIVAEALKRRSIGSITHHAVVKIFDSYDLIVGRMMGRLESLISV
jgi:hypothetical protein